MENLFENVLQLLRETKKEVGANMGYDAYMFLQVHYHSKIYIKYVQIFML